MNPHYKEQLTREIDKMLDTRLIFLVDKSNWISSTVIHQRKDRWHRTKCGFHGLNEAYVHSPFPTSFNDEILEKVKANYTYSFIDGFSSYH
jgi:hypothetical protein